MKPCKHASALPGGTKVKCGLVSLDVVTTVVCATCQLKPTPERLGDSEYLTKLAAGFVIRQPTLYQKLKNVASAAVTAVKDRVFVDDPEFRQRQAICDGCLHWHNRECAVCGCKQYKLTLKSQQCPIGKWS